MKKQHYNLLVKRVKGEEFIISDLIATKLSKEQFEEIKRFNPKLLGDYEFCAYKDTDFLWWQNVHKYLTSTKLVNNVIFQIDYDGGIYKF